MKNLFYLLIAVFTLSLTSCSSDDSSTNNDDELYVRFTLNGEQKEYMDPATITSLRRLILGDDMESAEYERISLWMPVVIETGTFTITSDTPTDANLETLYSANIWMGEEVIDASTGTLVITDLDAEYVKGTFSFSGTNDEGTTVVVTNGTFRAYR
ncbi:DUF6252 family protein [Flavobacterium lacus]|uniref:Lipocalin-like protein n=1 Tax=Flavobacterium lacus TaxID=1353778 RepID=A0A328WYW5_9FLAO|nr:DUF6252 family protein [Flavobacterium lacus]RAR50465.1 hypothetical protein B0I10_102270 [Flavobacterium lacus]